MDNEKSWWATLIQGIVAVILGLYLLFGGVAAGENFRLVAGLYILIISILELWRGSGSVSRWRGIIGVIIGALILLLRIINLPFDLDLTIFAIGVIIVGILGLYASFFARSGRRFEWGPVIVNALLVLWGILIFYFNGRDADLRIVTGWILVIAGAAIALWGFFSRGNEEVVEETPKEVTPEDVQEKVEDTIEDATDEVDD
jgi:uncharacterized membrane protein HdeD (DUF308 family)